MSRMMSGFNILRCYATKASLTHIDFVNVPPTHSLDSLHKLVVENGGTFSMNLNSSVTHCVAAESKGIKYQAAKLRGDVIHCSWVFDCCSQKRLLPLQPKYFLFLSEHSKKKLQEEIDKFSDSYYQDLDISDIKQLLSNVDKSENSKAIEYYKKKYVPKEKWSCFHDCCICFHSSIQSFNTDWELLSKLAMRRMKLEVGMGGGKVGNDLSQATTHLVVFSVPGIDLDFREMMESFSSAEKHLLCNKKLHVVGYQWLEGCLVEGRRLQEQKYSLKPESLEESNFRDFKHDMDLEAPSVLDDVENQNLPPFPDKKGKQSRGKAPESMKILASPKRDVKRKRGRPAGPSTNKGKAGLIQARRTRPWIGKPAKIYESKSDASDSGENLEEEGTGMGGNHAIPAVEQKECPEITETEIGEHSESSQRGKAGNKEVALDNIHEEWLARSQDMELDTENKVDNSKDTDKLEVMVDPVQAMLLDMIPSLGVKKPESTSSIIEDEKPPVEQGAEPVKKKKVSYKDVAGALLKDW